MKPEISRLVFRMSPALRKEVEHYAVSNCHSLNDSLINLVKRGLAAEKAASNPVV